MSTSYRDPAVPVHVLLAVGFCACFVACASTLREAPFDSGPLYGMVYGLDSVPCDAVTVQVDGGVSVSTDSSGRFVVPALARGPHQLVFTKEGFERFVFEIEFQEPTQVVYLRMTSKRDLLDHAEELISSRQWEAARRTLLRVEPVDPYSPVAAYLRAIVDFELDDPFSARDELLSLLEAGYRIRAVFLFLADLYQYELEEPEKARAALEEILRLREDISISKRLHDLTTADSPGTDIRPAVPMRR